MASILPYDSEKNELTIKQQEADPEEYDEFRRPPILDICLKHQSATQFAIADATVNLNKDNVCPCCGQPVQLTQLPITASVLDFSFNGPGVSLYFDFLIFSSILIAVFIIVCGIYDIVASMKGDTCNFWNSINLVECKNNFYSNYAKSNQNNSVVDKTGSALNFIVTLIIIVLMFLYRKRINMLSNKIDEKSILPSDYSIIIENIPRDAKEDEIKQFFSHVNNKDLVVKKVCMGYQITEYLNLEQKKQDKENELTKILECERVGKPIPINFPKKQDLIGELNQLTLQLNQFEDNVESNFQFSGVAIVSFSLEDEAKWVCKSFRATRLHLIIAQFMKILGQKDIRRFRDNLIVVQKAPEPGDIIWKNLGVSLLEQYKRKFITNIATAFVLGICFGFLFGLSYAQFAIANSDNKNSTTASRVKQVAITILGVIASVLISVINTALATIIRKLSELEAPATRTEFDIIAAKKLGLAQFLNTTIMTLIVNLVIVEKGETSYSAVMKPGGLNQDVMLIFITNGIFPWLMNLLDPFFIYKKFQRYQIQQQGQSCNLIQKEANQIFSGPQIDLSKKYAQLGKTLMFTFFYAYLLPLGPVLSIASLFVVYWVEKVLLLRRDSKPAPTGNELAEEMIDFYGEFTLLIYSTGCLIWETILNDTIFPLTWVQFGLALFNFLFPLEILFNTFFKEDDVSTKELYDSQCYKFWDDYDRRNPVTSEKAIEEFLKSTTAQQSMLVDGRGNVIPKDDNIQKKIDRKKKEKQKQKNKNKYD